MTLPIIPAGDTFTLPAQGVWRSHCRTVPALAVSQAQPRHVEGTTWRLEAPGIYYWNMKAEHGVVLAYPADEFARVRLAFDLVVASTYYLNNPEDMTAFNLDPDGFTLSMLTRPRVTDLGCGQRNQAMGRLLAEMGVTARSIQWLGLQPVQGGHLGMEVQLPEWGWTAVDPFYGALYGRGRSALDIFVAVQAGVDPARLLWHWQSTLEGPEWTRGRPPESAYAEYAGAIGWSILPGTTDEFPLVLGAGATLEEMAIRGGLSNPVAYTEAQARATFYDEAST